MFVMSVTFVTVSRNTRNTRNSPYEDAALGFAEAVRLKALADSWPGMGLVALHHDRKALSEDFVDAVSGTNGIAGAADTIIVINRRRTEEEGRLAHTLRHPRRMWQNGVRQTGVWSTP